MRGVSSESTAALVLYNAADPVKLSSVCCTKFKLPYQTDSGATLSPDSIHQLGSSVLDWSGVWIRPKCTYWRVLLSDLRK